VYLIISFFIQLEAHQDNWKY